MSAANIKQQMFSVKPAITMIMPTTDANSIAVIPRSRPLAFIKKRLFIS
jgi:hypothetical protein